VSLLDDTPHDYYRDDLPASRGQMKLIAVEACKLLGLPEPTTREQASVAILKLRAANRDNEPVTLRDPLGLNP
jgi:hypothetical protein